MTMNTLKEYGNEFQTKVIASLISNQTFLQNISDVISSEYFDNDANKWLVNTILTYYREYRTTPQLEVFRVELSKIKNENLKEAVKVQLREAYTSTENNLDYVQKEFSDFCINQKLKNALMDSTDLLQRGDYNGIRVIIAEALKAGQDKNLGHEYKEDIEQRFREDNRNPIPTPWSPVNDKVLEGGLGEGDVGVILGGTGAGKSWGLVNIAGTAAKLGFNVIYYTLELSEEYIGNRFDSFFTGIPVNEVKKHRKEVEAFLETVPGEVIIKRYPPKRASIFTIENHIRKCVDLGKRIDMVIVDYMDLLGTKVEFKDKLDATEDIYVSAKGLAVDLNIPIWSASQVNRSGAKDEVVEADKVAGSYNKLFGLDAIFSLSRTKEDKVAGTGRLHVIKTRYGGDGMTYMMNVDLSVGKFEMVDEGQSMDELEEKQSTRYELRSEKMQELIESLED